MLGPMKPFSADTAPQAHEVYIRLLRARSVAERLGTVRRLNDAVDTMALARLRQAYPDASEREQRLRLQALKYGDELMETVFGWSPEARGR